jgi:bifunctional enzyme CysN/CysC
MPRAAELPMRGPSLLRFTTAGSVDDGKSTLIGRLLHDSRAVYEDQVESVRGASHGNLDLAFLTDGLRAEREQGITIDVAYRHFSTPRRRFIIADTPGHEQYTRNMATGASTADVAVLLADARKGILPQTRRHAYIAWLLGIRYIVLAVNKMDLVGWSRAQFDAIYGEFEEVVRKLPGCEARSIPLSALTGDNVARRSGQMPWFEGGSLLEYLETAPADERAATTAFRFPVQYVIRNAEFRGYAGQIVSGEIRPGDEILTLPSRRTARVRSICTYDGDLDRAFSPMSITLRLDTELDIGRGDMLVDPSDEAQTASKFRAAVVWMSETPLSIGRRPYLVRHTTQRVCGEVVQTLSRVDISTLEEQECSQLSMNDIGVIEMETHRPLFCDPYDRNSSTGAFILIDPVTNATLAGGMIREALPPGPVRANGGGRRGLVVWFTGLSGAGKSTISRRLYERLWASGLSVEMLDGDELRCHLTSDLGFTRSDRDENIRRISFVAGMLARNGVIALVSVISPYRAARDAVRAQSANFLEVYVNAPLAVCEARDPKGLYRKARSGQLRAFTGIDDPYEPPLAPEVECRTDRETPPESTDRVLAAIEEKLNAKGTRAASSALR